MSRNDRQVPTTRAVWDAIRAAHSANMVVFETYSGPRGECDDPSRGIMLTVWGFRDAVCGTMGALTRWDIDPDRPDVRVNEETRFWLCVPIEGDRDETPPEDPDVPLPLALAAMALARARIAWKRNVCFETNHAYASAEAEFHELADARAMEVGE
jgi:hypothetical protein